MKIANGDEKKVSVISFSGELVGKLIDHFCFLEDRMWKAGTEVWF